GLAPETILAAATVCPLSYDEQTSAWPAVFLCDSKCPIAAASGRAHVNCWRIEQGRRTGEFDSLHGHADLCQKQHAMVRSAARPRADSRVRGASATQPTLVGFRAFKLFDQSGGCERANSRKFHPLAGRGTGAGRSIGASVSGFASGRASGRGRRGGTEKDRCFH